MYRRRDVATLPRLPHERCDVGIVTVTGATDVADRVAGLNVGADDYEVTPFDLRESRARVNTGLHGCRRGVHYVPSRDAEQRQCLACNREVTDLSHKFPLHDDSRRAYAGCGIATDITDRMRSEDALRN